MNFKLLTEHHLEFLSLEGGCTGSSESTLVKIPHCWKSHVMAQLLCFSLFNCSSAVLIILFIRIFNSVYHIKLNIQTEWFKLTV